MSTSPSPATRLVEVVKKMLQGQATPDDVRAHLTAVSETAQAVHARFIDMAHGNPEVPQATRAEVERTLVDYEAALNHLTAALQGDRSALEQGLRAFEVALDATRHAQGRAATTVQIDGPTAFAYVNRLLFHLQNSAGPVAENRFVAALLKDLPEFLNRLAHDVETLKKSADADSADNLDAALNEFHGALEGVRDGLGFAFALQERLDRAVAAALALHESMCGVAVTSLNEVGTPLVAVNLALRAAEKLQNGTIDLTLFVEAMEKCREALRIQVPDDAAPELREVVRQVEDAVRTMERAARDGDSDGVESAVTILTYSAQSLGFLLSFSSTADWDDDVGLLDFMLDDDGTIQSGQPAMPMGLQAIIETGEAYLRYEVDESAVSASIEMLQKVCERFQERASRMARNGVEGIEGVLEGLDMLNNAANSIYAVMTTRDRRALEAARAELLAAGELFRSLQFGR